MEDRIKKALNIIKNFGDTDGAHHKQWVLDQIVRVLTGCPEQGLSKEYEKWIRDFMDGEDGPDTYYWDKGIAP
jgi:hypothetical protein